MTCEFTREENSPSKKYLLKLYKKENGKGFWNYSRGEVYRTSDNTLLATIDRNYSSFPFLFIENHPNSHDYLICGEDYQGQNVIELDTGKQKKGGYNNGGDGFCWASYELDIPHQILIVGGCYWASSYEFKFFDFHDPMNGWKEIEHNRDENNDYDYSPDNDAKSPTIETIDNQIYIKTFTSGTDDNCQCLKCYPKFDEEDDYDRDTFCRAGEMKAIKTFQVASDYSSFTLIEEKLSENEKSHRQQQKELATIYQEKVAKYVANDPLYLAYKELIKDPILNIEDYESKGITYKKWAPDFNKREARWCRRINKKNPRIDLEFADETGPVKLIIYYKPEIVNKFFPHSVVGLTEAIEYAKKIIQAERLPHIVALNKIKNWLQKPLTFTSWFKGK